MGEIIAYAGSVNIIPPGWALCNGATLSISQYSALFSRIGTTYGGDGQATFALPNLQGRAAVSGGTSQNTHTSDTVGHAYGSDTITLQSSDVIDATPTLTNFPSSTTGFEHAATIIAPSAQLADGNLDLRNNYSGATLTVARHATLNTADVFGISMADGKLSLSGANIIENSSAIASFSQSGGQITITFGAATSAQAKDVLEHITYVYGGTIPPASVLLDVTLNDGNTGSQGSQAVQTATQTVTFNITNVDDAPTGANGTVSTREDVAYTFSASDFHFSDPNDSPANNFGGVVITTLPEAGTLSDNGVAVHAGDTVSASDISGGHLTFTPAANANGAGYSSFTFQVRDDGTTANGGVNTDPTPRTLTVDVTSVNDAPSGTDHAFVISENATYTFQTSDFGFSDIEGNALQAVEIAALPSSGAGTLTDNGATVLAGQFVSAADISGGLLRFTPAIDSAASASFTFKVQDNGGTANGGVDTDPTSNTMTAHVAAAVGKTAAFNETGTIEYVTITQTGTYHIVADGAQGGSAVHVSGGMGAEATADVTLTAGTVLAILVGDQGGGGAFSGGGGGGTFVVAESGAAASALVVAGGGGGAGSNQVGAAGASTSTGNGGGTATGGGGFFGDGDNTSGASYGGLSFLHGGAGGSGNDGLGGFGGGGAGVSGSNSGGGGGGYSGGNGTSSLGAGGSGGGSFVTGSASGVLVSAGVHGGSGYFSLTEINQAPSGADDTVVAAVPAGYVFKAGDFGFTDTDGNSLKAVEITTLPSSGAGTLSDNGVAVIGGQFVSVADVNNGLLQFTPATNASGDASFTFQVQDDGGMAVGGVDTNAAPNTMTVHVAAALNAATDFSYSGHIEYVTVQQTGTYHLIVDGAQGGSGGGGAGGGQGAEVTADVTLAAGTVLEILVRQDGNGSIGYGGGGGGGGSFVVVASGSSQVALAVAGGGGGGNGSGGYRNGPAGGSGGLTISTDPNGGAYGSGAGFSGDGGSGAKSFLHGGAGGTYGGGGRGGFGGGTSGAIGGYYHPGGGGGGGGYSGGKQGSNYNASAGGGSFVNVPSVGSYALTASTHTGNGAVSLDMVPVLGGAGGITAALEQTAIAVAPALTLTDDSAGLASATVRIATGFQAGEDVLSFTNDGATMGNIIGAFDDVVGTLTLTSFGHTATVAQFQAALEAVTYTDTSDTPDTVDRTVAFIVNDGTVDSNTAIQPVSVEAVDDPPVVDLHGAALSYTENDFATAIASAATVTDVDNTNFDGGSLTISFGATGTAADQLTVDDQGTSAGEIGINGSDVTYGGVVIGTVAAGSNGHNGVALEIDLNGGATQAAVQALGQHILYANSSDDPATTQRTVTFTLADDGSQNTTNTGSDSATIDVTVVNDAPVIVLQHNIDILAAIPVDIFSTSGGAVDAVTGDGQGSAFSAFDETLPSAGAVISLALGDFNGDGLTDVAAVDQTNNAIQIFQEQDCGCLDPQPSEISVASVGVISAVRSADMNHDGHADLIVGGSFGVTILYGAGDGTFGVPTHLAAPDVQHLEIVDMNGDGRLDVVATSSAGAGGALVAAQQSAGTFTGFISDSLVTGATGPLAVGDIDGDTHPDVIVVNTLQNVLDLFTGSASGAISSTATQILLPSGSAPSDVALGDVNGDGHLDIVVTNAGSGSVAVLLGNGDSTFQPMLTYATSDDPTTVALADMNNDGKLDIVTGSGGADPSYDILLNNGDGTFQPDPYPIEAAGAVSEIALGNIDPIAEQFDPLLRLFTEGDTLAVAPNLELTDVDGSTAVGATVVLESSLLNPGFPDGLAQDLLAAVTTGTNITAIYDASTFTLTLTGNDTLADYQQVLRSVTFSSGSDPDDEGNLPARALQITIDDGGANGTNASAPIVIAVTPVNNPPALTPSSGITAAHEQVAIAVDPVIVLSDVDSSTFDTAIVGISAGFKGGQDVLSFTNTDSTTYGDITAQYDANTGVLELTSLSDATTSQWQAALRAVTYTDTSDNPDTGNRTISFEINDRYDNSLGVTKTVSVAAVNDAPTAIALSGTHSVNENSANGTVIGGLSDTDPDNGDTATYTLLDNAGGRFAIGGIHGDQLIVANGLGLDYEQASNETVKIQVTDSGGASFDETFNIGVLNIDPERVLGNSGNNFIRGGTMADTLDGGAGADTLSGGAGNDVYLVDNAGDRVVEAVNGGTDTVYAAVSYALQHGQSVELLFASPNQGTSPINLTGNELAQRLLGNDGNNVLAGGGGGDTMFGYDGNDTYRVSDASDWIVEAIGKGADTVLASVSYHLTPGASVELLETASIAGTSPINLAGNELAQRLLGNNGDNVLDGYGGGDTMFGYGGNDIYRVRDANDWIVDAAGQGSDTVFASISYHLNPGASVELLATSVRSGTDAINLTGNELSQRIDGNNGDNVLKGYGGGDTMYGFLGDDTFYVSSATDRVFEAAAQGSDTVFASVSYTLQAGQSIELLATASRLGTDAITLTGNEQAQRIDGNYGANSLYGGDGNDTLYGFDGNDRLGGGNGRDLMDGGSGHNVFAYSAVAQSTGVNRDLIQNMNFAQDKFDLPSVPAGIDTKVIVGTLREAAFDTDLANVIGSAQLAAHHAVLFDPSAGDDNVAGHMFLIVDVNGVAGYQAGADYVIELQSAVGTLTLADFV